MRGLIQEDCAKNSMLGHSWIQWYAKIGTAVFLYITMVQEKLGPFTFKAVLLGFVFELTGSFLRYVLRMYVQVCVTNVHQVM
ncbi:unnamed protein product [Xylocopa violacea]|uniref:Uncharacterized protein n=1 Tax=Xylocopa violacea TaxID=135666 RepID=A0ABP1N1Z2_XYLVO